MISKIKISNFYLIEIEIEISKILFEIILNIFLLFYIFIYRLLLYTVINIEIILIEFYKEHI